MVDRKKLSYGKVDGKKDMFPLQTEPEASPKKDGEKVPVRKHIDAPSGYSKRDGVLSYGIICVISGGTKRERTFLTEIEKKKTFRNLDVIFVSSPNDKGGLTPKMMLAEFEQICNDGVIKAHGRDIEIEDVDSFYMLTDVDHYENELKGILMNNKEKYPIWIISNPDFEIWLYYCYRNNPFTELADVVCAKPEVRSSLLKTINGTFNNNGGLDTRKAFEHLKDGIAHSKEHYREVDSIPTLLSTQMHVFAEDVLLRLGNEYENFLKSKQEFRKRMTV